MEIDDKALGNLSKYPNRTWCSRQAAPLILLNKPENTYVVFWSFRNLQKKRLEIYAPLAD